LHGATVTAVTDIRDPTWVDAWLECENDAPQAAQITAVSGMELLVGGVDHHESASCRTIRQGEGSR
jgi:hypothetical protein